MKKFLPELTLLVSFFIYGVVRFLYKPACELEFPKKYVPEKLLSCQIEANPFLFLSTFLFVVSLILFYRRDFLKKKVSP
jgi:hypothetical protein